jgi:cyclic pyranopterin monophosphate synthase
MCHPLPLSKCRVDVEPVGAGPAGAAAGPGAARPSALRVTCTASTTGPTGVEMEALVGASVAALTLYDMLKAAGLGMEVSRVRVLAKAGGAGGPYAAAGGAGAAAPGGGG